MTGPRCGHWVAVPNRGAILTRGVRATLSAPTDREVAGSGRE